MHSKINNIEILIGNETDEINEELFDSILILFCFSLGSLINIKGQKQPLRRSHLTSSHSRIILFRSLIFLKICKQN